MVYIQELLANRILLAGMISWAVTQIIKAMLYLIVNGSFEIERLFGDGGMPSGHSATVAAAALMTGMECGFASPIFAVMLLMAIIVMHDAMGVRQETGKQAKAINTIMDVLEEIGREDLSPEEKLKEFVGHSPLQVFIGAVLGVVVALLLNFVLL